MSNLRFDIVGFDLDGTLVESHRDLGAAVNHALRLGGFDPVPADSASDLIGGGAKIMLKQAIDAQGGLPDDEFRQLYKQMLAYYSEHNAVHTRAYPHAEEALVALADRGAKLALVTNKFEEFAVQILTKLGLAGHFYAIIGGNSLGKNDSGTYRAKPMPDPLIEARERGGGGSFAFVGDSSYDVKAARGAQVPVIGARYGYCDKPPGQLGADAEIDSLAELVSALERL
ncbi:HAD hydrolase-like protein [Qipengyuania sp. XHP0207]|uniref:HAD hydrolase-like protein n=1 Tax=Qipengyuania sp. XHP0207 TaxID=3038078 RepID=UPI00241F9442|nr:HAD hydrolase-like protein [Qipengyuania sp. XHP0207]MDG5747032.1 HAD hydrolase-like protein [Qipengyuania sp. XHP0207]